ncbi:MATE family efflux transporter [Erysipelotrichaceae bacterium RD49]|nr:MATE family efflux transporter [Erysipelotrichaceae bacterium RD49]
MSSELLLSRIRQNESLDASQQRKLILMLSWPAILAQISVTVMQLIDASMVGQLGTNASAAIGLVASSTWLINGVSQGIVFGFSVQTAQAIGAMQYEKAGSLCRQGMLAVLILSIPIALAGSLFSRQVPYWLGGQPEVVVDAGLYLMVFCFSLPFSLLNDWAVKMLQSAGDTKIPGLTQIAMCFFDVLFNALFIYGMHLGVLGAALGTMAAIVCASLFLTAWVYLKNPFLKRKASFRFHRSSISKALQIGLPISIEQLITGTSYVAFTRIVSTLGTVSVAANSFAITAESLCYMPGYGCASAATAIVGQAVGAGRNDLAKEVSWRITRIAMIMMSCSGLLMFILSQNLMAMLTPVVEVQQLGARLLRLEAFAEPMYGASIAITGILRAKGDTIWPACLNFISIWCVRIPIAWVLSSRMGLIGPWIAMNIELNVRGLLFLFRLRHAFPIRTKLVLAA